MDDGAVQAAVREKVEAAEIHRVPFPHVVIDDLVPVPFFRRLADSIPSFDAELSQKGIKANLSLETDFDEAPEEFRAAWGRLRDEIVPAAIVDVLARRLEDEIREKYAEVYSPEIADEIMAGGLVSTDGRIMLRKPGYTLQAHTDPARFAVTCLLYFTSAGDDSSGALCFFEPERTPEVRHTATYYPDREEGIGAKLAKVIPISENLFVAFLNGFRSLHGVRVERGKEAVPRLAFQTHILPRHDPRKQEAALVERLSDPGARTRWEAWMAEKRSAEVDRPAVS
jgi:hypothetical protein